VKIFCVDAHFHIYAESVDEALRITIDTIEAVRNDEEHVPDKRLVSQGSLQMGVCDLEALH
jgi:hypothetical protein